MGREIAAPVFKAALLDTEALHLLDDHFAQDAKDADWIPDVGERGWVIVTKDAQFMKNPLEQRAFLAAGTAVFVVANGHAKADRVGAALALAAPGMRTALRRFDVPFLARVTLAGEVVVIHADGDPLDPPKTIKVRRAGSKKFG